MPPALPSLRQTVRRAGRSISFQRSPHPERPAPPSPHAPPHPHSPPHPPTRSRLASSRSFPSLSRFLDRARSPSPPRTAPSASPPPSPHPPSDHHNHHDYHHTHHTHHPHHNRNHHPAARRSSASPRPSTSTITASEPSSVSSSRAGPPADEPTLPPPSRPFLRRLSASQRLSRLSLSRARSRSRSRSRTPSFAEPSFADPPSPRASSSTSSLSPRAATDDFLWTRLRGSRGSRARSMRRNRLSSYSCSDFEIAEEDALVEIGERLPDRVHSAVMEDVFGRRRGDLSGKIDDLLDADRGGVLAACEVEHVDEEETLREGDMKRLLRNVADNRAAAQRQQLKKKAEEQQHLHRLQQQEQQEQHYLGDTDDEVEEQEETMRNIARAIDSSKGRLRKSANMSKAFRAVIKSGEGLVRKSELIRATLQSDESKDPSMIILLDPGSCDPALPQVEGCTTSEESGSAETVSSANAVSSAAVGFSTSMTAKQCAATLETMLREMTCRVSRMPDMERGMRDVVRLRVVRTPPGAKKMDRKVRILITIREEDHIRTSVSFKRIAGLYSSRDSHIPLCTDIRDRFQREWPAVVEALYIRLPNVPIPLRQQQQQQQHL